MSAWLARRRRSRFVSTDSRPATFSSASTARSHSPRQGDLDGAILAWREVLSTVPALTSVHLQIGALYERQQDLERARATYRHLLELEPGNAKALAAISQTREEILNAQC